MVQCVFLSSVAVDDITFNTELIGEPQNPGSQMRQSA